MIMWDKLKQTLLTPRLDEQALEDRLRQVTDKLPTPVFWLLGKAQSGKTSLIRALTGDSRAAIGDGFRPCTRTAQVYDFPNPDHPILRFLDTRGLGEIAYDPHDDIAAFTAQAHVLIVVMKALDHAQQPVMDALRDIRRQRPDWPVIVVQTTLHEGYPDPAFEHLQPYPYAEQPWPPAVPDDLARSLAKQRALFTDIKARFVPVDFTLPEDGYTPVHYGSAALWHAIEEALPLGLAALVRNLEGVRQELQDAYAHAAHPHILSYALAAGAAGAIPIPFVDIPLVTLIQFKLFQTLASIYGQDFSRQHLREIGGALGISFLSNLGRRELLKFVPGYGAAVSSVFTAATTYALGKTLAAYFAHVRRGDSPDAALFQRLYAEQFEQGRQALRDTLRTVRREEKP